MTNYQKRKEKNDEYRSKIMRFTFQLSLGDSEVREWFEQQPEKGAYLKDLILRDKAERLGYREQKSAKPDKAGDYEIIQSIRTAAKKENARAPSENSSKERGTGARASTEPAAEKADARPSVRSRLMALQAAAERDGTAPTKDTVREAIQKAMPTRE